MESLTGTHFYGRRLVLEWAKEDSENLGTLRKRAGQDTTAINYANNKKKRTIDDGDTGIEEGGM